MLVKVGFIELVIGVNGGYKLVELVSSISFFDVI